VTLSPSSTPQLTSIMDCVNGHRQPTVRTWGLLRRLLIEDDGQDIVEYAFLGAFIGIAGWLTLQAIEDGVLETYQIWLDPTSGTPSVWEPPEPIVVP